MKRRLLSILLATTLVVMSITGCGEKTTNNENAPSTQESVQQSTEAPTPEPTEAPTPEPTQAPTPEPTEEPTPEPTEAPSEWAAAYEGYFERDDIMGDNIQMATEVSEDGLTFGIVVATAGGNTYMSYDFGTIALDMYSDTEKIYTCTRMDGEEVWSYALIESQDDVNSVMSMDDTGMVDTSSFTSYEYVEEVTEDGVVYDVLSFVAEDDGETLEGLCYVNRETQKIRRMIIDTEAGPTALEITDIESVEIPAEAANATEVTMDDVMGTVISVIMVGALSGMEGLEEGSSEMIIEPAEGVEIVEPDKEIPTETTDVEDWSVAYDDYFEREQVVPENIKMTTSFVAEGVAIDAVYAQAGDVSMMTYDFDQIVLDIYADAANVYIHGSMSGEEDEWKKAVITSQEEVEELIGTEITTAFASDTIKSQSYREEIVEDDVVYDVIDVVLEEDGVESEVTCYINRETQYISRMVMIEEGETALCYIEEIDSLEIPQEAMDSEEGTMEEVSEIVMGMMMLGVLSAMGEDLSALE